MQRQWRLIPHDTRRVEQLARAAGLPPVVAQLLVSRGIYDADAAANFLDTKLIGLRDPRELPGIGEAVEILVAAIADQTPITIYGDYDCDGMTGTAILVNGLRLLGADVGYHVPNRLEDGYGLNETAIHRLAARGRRLLVTVDCGISSVAHAELCRELGLRLIITDHHRIGETLPEADAIVHPRLPGTAYPFGELCGAAVAFKLAWAVCQRVAGSTKVTEPMREYLLQSLGLAAIGTVADVVPLLDENRILVCHGLRTLADRPLPGLAALMQVSGLDRAARLDTESISFNLAPRLNAAGRLGQAQLAVELMTAPDGDRVRRLAEHINQLNSDRDTLQRRVQLAARKQATTEFNVADDPALVLAGVGWHQGVIGVVAGRLADQYAKPVLVLSLDGAGRSEAVGSGRVGGTAIDLYAALDQCRDHLIRFGGHQAAAGLAIDERRIPAFRDDFCEAVAQQWSSHPGVPEIRIDAEAALGQLTLQTVQQLQMLEPFGAGNPRPVLFSGQVELDAPAKRMGGGDRHLTVHLRQGGKVVRGVAFGGGDWCEDLNAADGPLEIAYRPVINEFRGYRKVEVHLVDWRVAESPVAVS